MSAVLDVLPPKHGLFHIDEPTMTPEPDESGCRKILHPGMWPSQRLWWDMKNSVRLFIAGYGAGKTKLLCQRMITLALQNAPVPVAIVSPTYSMAQETVILTTSQLLSGLAEWLDFWRGSGLKRAKLEWRQLKKSPHEFMISYHEEGKRSLLGRILIYSGEEPDNLKGTNLAAAGIDEPFIQDFKVFDQMFVRCRHPQARKREINLTGTPENISEWGYDLAEGELSKKYDVGIVQASTFENKALPIAYLKALEEAWDPKVAQAYLHGMFVNLSTGLVYYAFDRTENVVELPMPQGAELGVGLDFNVNPMAASVFWVVRKGVNRHIHFFDEIELPNSDTEAMCHKLRQLYGAAGPTNPFCAPKESVDITSPLEIIYPDANAGRSTSSPGGKTDYDYILEAGFVMDKGTKNPDLRDRFNSVNAMLRPNGGRVRMTFSPRCKKLIKYQMVYSYEEMDKKSQRKLSHLLDSRDYPICRLFPADRERMRFVHVRGA